MNTVKIRRPRIGEKEELHQLFRKVLTDTCEKNKFVDYEAFLKEELDYKRKCLELDFQSQGRENFFFVAEIAGKIVGTIEYGQANDLIKKSTDKELEGLFEVGTVFVHPQYQYQGIGKLLLKYICNKLMDEGIEEVCLDSGYATAQKVWNKRFGKPEYYFKDYFGEGLDYMVWRLKVEALSLKNNER